MSQKNKSRQVFGVKFLLVLAIILIVASCSSTQRAPIRPQSTGKTIKSSTLPEEDLEPVIITSSQSWDLGVTDVELFEREGEFIDMEAAGQRPEVVSEDGEIVLNFEGESVQSVVHTILGEVLQETFVIAPGVGGEVTFSTSRPVSR